MSVKVFNPTQLRTELSKEIKEYRKITTSKKMEALIERILFEREILFNEIDTLKEAQNRWIRRNDLNDKHSLLIDEIDELLYNDFYNLSKKLKHSPGEVLTSLMEEFVLKYDGAFPDFSANSLQKLIKTQEEISIHHQDQLTITNNDLLDLSETNMRISFTHIDTLEFVNIDLDTFKDFVSSINGCRIVRVPQTIPKLLLYAKCHHCSYFEFFEEKANPKLDTKKIEYAKEANKVVEDWKNGT
jgi:hypothetical protein